MTYEFKPHPLARASMIQTLLAKYKPKRLEWLLKFEQPTMIDAGYDVTGYSNGESVRLLAYYSPSATGVKINGSFSDHSPARIPSRGLVMTLHGWGGCSHSTYNMLLTDALVRAGYDVVRLNLRDHGPNIHVQCEKLNVGFFLGTLIEEAAAATEQITQLAGDRPFYIIGASMGGNFALRLALWHSRFPFHNLRQVVAISPAINPAGACDAVDAHYAFGHYFRSLWLRSLQAKQRFFPQYFDFTGLEKLSGIRAMTEWVAERYGDYENADDYFTRYSVSGESLAELSVPTTILTARDDPVIQASDFALLPTHPLLELHILNYGGHVGFADLFPYRHCLPGIVLDVLR